MKLRTRLSLLVAAAVALAVAAVAVAAFVSARNGLRGQVDNALAQQARSLAVNPVRLNTGPVGRPGTEAFRQLFASSEVVFPDGSTTTLLVGEGQQLKPSAMELAVARGERGESFRDVRVGGQHLRVIAEPIANGDGAVVVTRSLTEVDHTLSELRLALGVVGLIGVAVAATLGLVVAHEGLRPVDRLTESAEQVAATQRLDARIEVRGRDEIARLAQSFNAMLAALEGSRQRQRQLVADAGHELRTPLTSLRTNIELLIRADSDPSRRLDGRDRAALLRDLGAQVEELTGLVGDLVELARDEERPEDVVEIELASLVERAAERVRLRAPGLLFDLDLHPAYVLGRPASLERAVTNLLDNAVKFSPPDGTVRVRAADGEVVVADEGPGIDPADVPHVFERFWRSASARGLPGSGLGLSIVAEAASSHGGTVTAERAPWGGALMRLRLPTIDVSGDDIDIDIDGDEDDVIGGGNVGGGGEGFGAPGGDRALRGPDPAAGAAGDVGTQQPDPPLQPTR